MGKPINRHLTFTAGSANVGPITITTEKPDGQEFWAALPIYQLNSGLVEIPTMTPTPPRIFMEHIGLVAIAWGEFEQFFDRMLRGLLDKQNADEPNWEGKSFRERRKLFIRHTKFALHDVGVLRDYLLRVVDDAVDLYRDRNLLVHGQCAASFYVTGPGTPANIELLFYSGYGNKYRERNFSYGGIEAVGYRILHLSGRLKTFSRNDVEAPSLSSSEKSVALDLWNRGFRNLPVP